MDLVQFQSHYQSVETACESEAGRPVWVLSRYSSAHSTFFPHFLIILMFTDVSVYPMGKHENERRLETNYYIEFLLRDLVF